MPQLFPMNWMFMTLFFLMLFIFSFCMTFFFPMIFMKMNFIEKKKNNKTLKW
uniref:ATP synthase F0 subunit 8 n=1 Tax=Ixodes confusus TaxID=2932796 RepID=UPI001FF19EAB|nr:ATP synthase F0 subunit 8 [Ixodes confusus]UOK09790.1 ATP synthase subunit 8 [Ixodes confusus]UOK09803.1 ATP synthase subunit 8 [Ixodes confusus]UOK09816.1 ATP synthase subunit 8 [Ixodes confusus]UOK09829.1 ATP synthase subunit 8 [Ixodes confusus]UOK09842.1 ATP synthase subunit 8 [Ixodes confusus]